MMQDSSRLQPDRSFGRKLLRQGRRIGEAAASRLYRATGGTASFMRRQRVQFLCFHHLFEDERKAFGALLEHLARGHQFVPYSEAVARVLNGPIDGRYLAVTFDDGLKNHLEAGRILHALGIAACFFICPSVVGEADERKLEKFCRTRLLMRTAPFLSWTDVQRLLDQGHEIGCHTMSHADLATLPQSEAAREIIGSREMLVDRVGESRHFAWPFGRFGRVTPTAIRAVFDAGFLSCASVERGCHTVQGSSTRSLCIRRQTLVATWPVDYIDYLLARSSRIASARTNQWPRAWRSVIDPGCAPGAQHRGSGCNPI
jgi:peptidoglycan/xylan/chitin deacetylase (PgdA/CDA1 family)